MKWGTAKKPRDSGPDTVQLSICDARLTKVSQVLRRFLPEAEHERCWGRYRPVLERHQLFEGSPFKNIVKFAKLVAREHGLDDRKERKLRKALFALSFGDGNKQKSRGRKTVEVRADQINSVRFTVPGMKKFEKATIVVTSPRTLWLVTKRGMILGTPVTILLKNQSEDDDTHSALLFRGNVKKISDLDLGSRHKYLINVTDTELKVSNR